MATTNVKVARNSGISLREAETFVENTIADRNNRFLVFGDAANDALGVAVESATVFVAKHSCGPDDAYSRPDTDWVSGIKHGETGDGDKIIRRLDRQGYRTMCGNLALMRDRRLQGYTKSLCAKIAVKLYTAEGEQEATFYANLVQAVVITGPTDEDEAQAESE